MPDIATTPLIRRFYTNPATDVHNMVDWESRDTQILDADGTVIFEQKGIRVPVTWSNTALKITAQKYFAGPVNGPGRESSVQEMIDRVADTLTEWGVRDGYFEPDPEDNRLWGEEAVTFNQELKYLLLTQRAAFNSPVWFNVGVPNTNGAWCWSAKKKKAVPVTDDMIKPQVSACFITRVEDTMEDILQQAVREGMIFANGSGSGSNLSTLRGSMEKLSGGGTASGPISFMKGYDAFAGVIKSGGKTRRAAKMVILNADHPDIEDFVACKMRAEKVAQDLISGGYNPNFDTAWGAYDLVPFQNANHSVRVNDAFMRAVAKDEPWPLKSVKTGEVLRTVRARDLYRKIGEAAWGCGDPGIQFHTTVNSWNVVADTAEIRASNPCSEYMFLDDSACNLASLNAMRFLDENGNFDIAAYCHAVNIIIVAQDILVDNGGYPTEKIALNSHLYRPLGLGFANLGGLLLSKGLPYDSDAGREWASGLTSLMTAQAAVTSARLTERLGSFAKFDFNRKSALRVLLKHHSAASKLHNGLGQAALLLWNEALSLAEEYGQRNAQLTLFAPTGTIGFLMDCDTTGIEPELNLVKYKNLVGGGLLKIVNGTVSAGLQALGYSASAIEQITKHIEETGSPEGCSVFKTEHLPVFDTSFPAGPSRRSIPYMGHVRMMAAVQPFISGAISKTVNMPEDATVEDILKVYTEAWELGLKSIAIYRNGSKGSQPLSSTSNTKKDGLQRGPVQRKMVGDRPGKIHEFNVGGHKGYLMVGLYEDNTPGEIFISISKEGSTISGLLNSIAILTSFALQHGVPLEKLVKKFSHMKFEPSGWTSEIGYADSLTDYIFRWMGKTFLGQPVDTAASSATSSQDSDTPLCAECGHQMVRNGACHKCPNCGGTSGCS